jgi:N-acetylmuramoyl-L-alanine amidase
VAVKKLIGGVLSAVLIWAAAGAWAQGLQAIARIDVAGSAITERVSGDVDIRLLLSQPVPFRVFTLTGPARLVLDFREVDWSGFSSRDLVQSDKITDLRFGVFRPGWSRMVMDLARPMTVHAAELKTDAERGTGLLTVRLTNAAEGNFIADSRSLQQDAWALPKAMESPPARTRQIGDRPLFVVVDPGHGGIDPGAERQGYFEKDLMLKFARELKDALILSGRYRAALTREGDIFISLPARVSLARQLGADVLVSLHADALAEGSATGSTVYTLSEKASNAAAAELAAQHDRADLLAGVDLSDQDDQVAEILMDLARVETSARSEMLASMMVTGIAGSVGRIRKRPHLSAGFTVLKAPDIPSVLLELGFISNQSDLSNLLTVGWRQKIISGILQALDVWSVEDAAQAKLLRR